jgi:hypothetical protein
MIFYTVSRTPWTGDQPVASPLPAQTQNKRTQTSVPQVEFEPTIPMFERAKTVHALDLAATVMDRRFPLAAVLKSYHKDELTMLYYGVIILFATLIRLYVETSVVAYRYILQ